MQELYIGIMSGTSLDGIDAVVVDFSHSPPKLIGHFYRKYHDPLRHAILTLCEPGTDEINRLAEIDIQLGKEYAKTIHSLLNHCQLTPKDIRAIGNHGQTIRHYPHKQFTLQVGDPNMIAAETGITTIADFRRADIAQGGQGAPLVPAFHQALFRHSSINRVIVNIGGIANITLLPAETKQPVIGFDTGPGNLLLNVWIEKHLHVAFDEEGNWGKTGRIIDSLLHHWRNDPFFHLPAPKSTGREYFNLAWIQSHLPSSTPAVDIQATLTELTAWSIIDAIKHYFSSGEIFICGGGVHNKFLLQRLHYHADSLFNIASTSKLGIDPTHIEAFAFAWLARQTLTGKPGNLPTVTGARRSCILGALYQTIS